MVRARRRNHKSVCDVRTSSRPITGTARIHMSLALRDPGGDADEDVLARHHRRRDRLTTLAIGVLTVDQAMARDLE